MIPGVDGELVRTNVTDNEPGVPLYADFQVIDVSTCEPISGVYLDFWHGKSCFLSILRPLPTLQTIT